MGNKKMKAFDKGRRAERLKQNYWAVKHEEKMQENLLKERIRNNKIKGSFPNDNK